MAERKPKAKAKVKEKAVVVEEKIAIVKSFEKESFAAFQRQIDSGSTVVFKDSGDFLEKVLYWAKESKLRKDMPVKDLFYHYLHETEYFVTDLDRAIVKLKKAIGCEVSGIRKMKTKYTVAIKKDGKKSTAFITTDLKRWGFGDIEVADL